MSIMQSSEHKSLTGAADRADNVGDVGDDGQTNIKVLVRVRPLLPREQEAKSQCLVAMPPHDPKSTILTVPPTSTYHSSNKKAIADADKRHAPELKHYRFDESVWSFDPSQPNYTTNHQFYAKSGPEIINHFFQGFNVCLLAYGQTGSGKTYTMMGQQHSPGLIPLIIRDILHRKHALVADKINCELKLSYVEIYNEQVKDLLVGQSPLSAASSPSPSSRAQDTDHKKCRVREHPVTGPYVENVNDCELSTYDDFITFLNHGNSMRATAATSMNDKSSRSHAIITVSLKQTRFTTRGDTQGTQEIGNPDEEMVSNIKLVDLAGSERLSKTKVFGQHDRVKEGTLINKSLTVLGRCINLLATNSSSSVSAHGTTTVIPYRDSILTYLLKENLAGNSKSFMIFCISPIDFDESYQTLNYANQVKKIKTAAKANKTKLSSSVGDIEWQHLHATDQSAIESLKKEIANLTEKLNTFKDSAKADSSSKKTLAPPVLVTPTTNHDSGKFPQLIAYFERESARLKFENLFLKSKLDQRDQQCHELTKHVEYMDQEFLSVLRQLHAEQSSKKCIQVNEFETTLKDKQSELQSALDEFDPRKVF